REQQPGGRCAVRRGALDSDAATDRQPPGPADELRQAVRVAVEGAFRDHPARRVDRAGRERALVSVDPDDRHDRLLDAPRTMGAGRPGSSALMSKPRSYEATADPLAPGRGHLRTTPPGRGTYGVGHPDPVASTFPRQEKARPVTHLRCSDAALP